MWSQNVWEYLLQQWLGDITLKVMTQVTAYSKFSLFYALAVRMLNKFSTHPLFYRYQQPHDNAVSSPLKNINQLSNYFIMALSLQIKCGRHDTQMM